MNGPWSIDDNGGPEIRIIGLHQVSPTGIGAMPRTVPLMDCNPAPVTASHSSLT